MAAKNLGLGRGLGALIKETPVSKDHAGSGGQVIGLPIARIHKSAWQPRRNFAPEALEDLVRSVKERGLLQPLLVRRIENPHAPPGAEQEYEVIAGERRLRAAQVAELQDVPAIVMDATDSEALELALVENLQREDLNVIEEAEGYRLLTDRFDLTQEDVAQRVGKARATVANCLRLLGLPDSVKALVAENRLSAGHAKVLMGLDRPEEQELLARRAVRDELSVRTLERIVSKSRMPPRKPRAERSDIPADHVRYLSERLHHLLGTSIRISPCKTLANGKKAKGCIEIDYYSSEELDRLLGLFGLSEDL